MKQYIDRETYLRQLVDRMDNGEVKIITGPRRSGKSWLLNRIFKDYLLGHGVPEENIIIVSFDMDDEEENGDLLHLNLTNKWPDMGDELLIIADLIYGDMICYDCERHVIVQWDHEIGEVTIEWDSFADWLREEMKIGNELVGYDGTDKEE